MDLEKKRKGLLLLGGVLLMIGLICNEWFLARVFSPDGTLILPTRILIWVFDITLIIVGAIVLYRRDILVLFQLSATVVASVVLLLIANWYLGRQVFAELYLHRRNPYGTGSYRLIPNLELKRTLGRTTYVIRTNSHGMHWREVAREKSPDKLRIAFIGDSFTFGCCADQVSNSFVGVFDAQLDQDGYETLNFGVPGYGLADEALQFQEQVIPFKPDLLVVVLYTGNDFSETTLSLDERNRVRETPDRRMFINSLETAAAREDGAARSLIRSVSDSAIFFLLGMLWEKEGKEVPISEFQVEQDFNSRTYWSQIPYPKLATRSIELYLQILETIRKICIKEDMQLMIVSIPYKEQVYATNIKGPGYDVRLPQSRVESYAMHYSIPYLDLLQPLREFVRKENRDVYFHSDPHFNNVGHALVGKHVAAFVRQTFPVSDRN